MKCPECGSHDLSVQDSRQETDEVRRRRICGGCGTRYMTVEKIVDVYVPAAPGRPASKPREKPVSVKKVKKTLAKRTEARRKIEDMKDTFEEDYSMYDDLADVGHLWK